MKINKANVIVKITERVMKMKGEELEALHNQIFPRKPLQHRRGFFRPRRQVTT